MKENDKIPEIRIRIPDSMHDSLKNIASHAGQTVSSIVRPVLRKFIDEQPPKHREPFKDI